VMSHAESVDSRILDTAVESLINGQLLYSNGGHPKGRLPV